MKLKGVKYKRSLRICYTRSCKLLSTGPFMLKDFVSGNSATPIKNLCYKGYDERYPQNQIPYIYSLKFRIIPDNVTAPAATRSDKIDVLDRISLQNAQLVRKTNPEILKASYMMSNGVTVDPRNDVHPFNDIRVRKAMQMAETH